MAHGNHAEHAAGPPPLLVVTITQVARVHATWRGRSKHELASSRAWHFDSVPELPVLRHIASIMR
eukprot:5388452-Alexandrium_andersonii.AAC.1